MWKLGIKSLALAAAALLPGAGAQAQDRRTVVTVNYALQYFTQTLVGDAAEVVFPVPAGEDPSFWRPSISDISAIQSADLIVLNGAGFAPWVDRVSLRRSKVVNTSASFKDLYIKTESITHSHGDGGEHSHTGTASYIWLHPYLAVTQAEEIAAALIRRKIAPKADVEAKMAQLKSDLEAVTERAEDAVEDLQGETLIATHPRYQYFARGFGLQIEALEWEAGAMPTEAELADLSALASKTGATILIWEAAPPQEAVDAVSALGLRSVIFPPLAQAPAGGDFMSSFRAAMTDLFNASK